MPNAQIPAVVSQCRCYLDNTRLNCTGELTLPNFTRPTTDVSGAGISGTISTPIQGNLDSMEAAFASRNFTNEIVAAFSYGTHDLEFRGIIQGIDAQKNCIEQRFSAFMKVIAKGVTSGVINNSAEMGCNATFEVLDITIQIDGVTYVDISKVNNIVRFRNSEGKLIDENKTAQDWLSK